MNAAHRFLTSFYLTFAKHPTRIPVILHRSSLAKAPCDQRRPPTLDQLKAHFTYAVIAKSITLKSASYYQCMHASLTLTLRTDDQQIDMPLPVLQIGSHYFSGFRQIIAVIESKYPHPSLFPTKTPTTIRGLVKFESDLPTTSNRSILSFGLYSLIMHALTATVISKPTLAERALQQSNTSSLQREHRNPIRHLNWYFALRPGLAYDTVYPHLTDTLVNEFLRYIHESNPGYLNVLGESLFPARARFNHRINECDALVEERFSNDGGIDAATALKVAKIYHDEGVMECRDSDDVVEKVQDVAKHTIFNEYKCGGLSFTVSMPTRDLTTRRLYQDSDKY